MSNSAIPSFKVLFIPLLVEQLFSLLLGQVDVLMLSQYSDNSVAAVGLANQLLVVVTMIFGFINLGTTIQLTQLSSTNDKQISGTVTSHAFFLTGLFTIALSLTILLFSDQLLRWMQTPDILMKESGEYLRIIAYGLFFQALIGLIASIFRSYSMVRLVMTVTIGVNITNIVFNYMVLYTPITILGTGVAGVAVATNVSRILGAAVLLIAFFSHKKHLFGTISWTKIRFHYVKRLIALGVPSAGEHVSYNVSQLIITSFIAVLGAASITAKIYTQTVTALVFTVSMAISQTSQLIVGKLIGAKSHESAYNFSIKVLGRSIALSTIITSIIAFCSFFIVPFLTDDRETQQLMTTLIFLSILLEPARTGNVLLVSALNVSGDIRYPVFVSIIIMWGVVIPLSYVVGVFLGFGLIGIWLVFILDEWLRFSLLYRRWKQGKWKSINLFSHEQTG